MIDFGVYTGKKLPEKTNKTFNIVGDYFTKQDNRRKLVWNIIIKNSKY